MKKYPQVSKNIKVKNEDKKELFTNDEINNIINNIINIKMEEWQWEEYKEQKFLN